MNKKIVLVLWAHAMLNSRNISLKLRCAPYNLWHNKLCHSLCKTTFPLTQDLVKNQNTKIEGGTILVSMVTVFHSNMW